ncbi:MAG TPA: hypothetical protein PLL77_04990 [Pyrinomonadaceae bacterium]|nr:hypothetical protein [Pyrinomonadaceae bacterium]
MNKQFSDEQLDQMMRTMIADASLDDAAVNEIADSPTMWWAVQRQIAEQNATVVSPWPPVNIIRRLLMIGIPATVAAALLISLFVFRSDDLPKASDVAAVPTNVETPLPQVSSSSNDVPPNGDSDIKQPEQKRAQTIAASLKTSSKQTKKQTVSTQAVTKEKTEIKTEFIALSYARNPDSGQIVRVKVPSSMMVTLGLVASVEKPSNLVDAEVVIGDDGLTRAIRFIR